jgi:hypothetical protein
VEIDRVASRNSGKFCQRILGRVKSQPSEAAPPAVDVGKPRHIRVLVLVAPSCKATLLATLRKQLTERNQEPVIIWDPQSTLDQLDVYIEKCEYMIVATARDFLDGMAALGIAKCRQKKVIELHRRDSTPGATFSGLRNSWDEANLEEDVEKGLNKVFSKTARPTG